MLLFKTFSMKSSVFLIAYLEFCNGEVILDKCFANSKVAIPMSEIVCLIGN